MCGGSTNNFKQNDDIAVQYMKMSMDNQKAVLPENKRDTLMRYGSLRINKSSFYMFSFFRNVTQSIKLTRIWVKLPSVQKDVHSIQTAVVDSLIFFVVME